jgi:hypothetical protein
VNFSKLKISKKGDNSLVFSDTEGNQSGNGSTLPGVAKSLKNRVSNRCMRTGRSRVNNKADSLHKNA